MGCCASETVASRKAIKGLGPQEQESVGAALVRLEEALATAERLLPAQGLALLTEELQGLAQELQALEEDGAGPLAAITKTEYANTLHQLFLALGLYKQPELATENEDFVANINRKEMRRVEAGWIRERRVQLGREIRALHAQLARLQQLRDQLQRLTARAAGPGVHAAAEAAARAEAARCAAGAAALRLRAAAEHAQRAHHHATLALHAWDKLPHAKAGAESVRACAEACWQLVWARCEERGARRALHATHAPRPARHLRLALDYAFTDHLLNNKYSYAKEVFAKFKEAAGHLLKCIHQVVVSSAEGVAAAEAAAQSARLRLRSLRLAAADRARRRRPRRLAPWPYTRAPL